MKYLDHFTCRFVGSKGQVPLPTHYFLSASYCDGKATDRCADKAVNVMSFIIPHKPSVTSGCWQSLTTMVSIGLCVFTELLL